MKKKLKDFQIEGVLHLSSNFHAALGDQRGLGKTVQAIYAAEMVNARTVLVTCPASVRSSWWEHIEEHYGHTRGWDVFSYNAAVDQRYLLKEKYDVWIGDELHFCKNLASQRTQAVFGKDGLARRAAYKWPLSGTFAPNHRPVELYPMLKALCPTFRGISYADYTGKFCGAFFDGHGMNVKGATHLDELKSMMSSFLLRRTKREVYPDLLDPLVSCVPVDLTMKDLEEVHAAEDEIGGREMRISSRFDEFSQLGDSSRLLRLLGEAKVKAVARFVDDLLAVEKKVVVFFQHTSVGKALQDHFEAKRYMPVVYQGGMSDGAKDHVKAMFVNHPGCRVFLGQRQAAGTGINDLQKVCSVMVIAEPRWTPGDTEQIVGRLDRMGQEADIVNAYVLYARGTLDAVVVSVHERKEAVGAHLNAAPRAWVGL